jgi:hypothetical protein
MTKRSSAIQRTLAFLGAALAGIVALTAASAAGPGPTQTVGQAVAAPTIPGAAGLPGPVAPPAKEAASMGILHSSVDSGVAGTKFTLSGSGLPANKSVAIEWATAKVTWVLDVRPDSVDYIGQKATTLSTVLASATTDASGSLSVPLTAPHDFGGIHDIYAVVDGVEVAKGGFLVDRTLKITPTHGPIGTPITISVGGLGSTLYGGAAGIFYDNHYTGVATGKWTRGDATVTLRAAGPVGAHTIVVGTGMQFNYLNIEQSPIPWATGGKATFTVTKDAGRPKAHVDWPLPLKPTVDQKTTTAVVDGGPTGTATASLDTTYGAPTSKTTVTAAGLAPNSPVSFQWSTVVGNRVNCTGTCWSFVAQPLGTATTGADGTVHAQVTVPDGLGGWHMIQVVQGGKVAAEAPFNVTRVLIDIPKVVKAGETFEVHLKGVGWTQLDNTLAVDYDNSYVGYGCGFNSNGDVVLKLVATGAPGTHLIDIYPLLYPYQPAYQYPPHGAVPFLAYARDYPGLALGYRLPAFRLAVTVK